MDLCSKWIIGLLFGLCATASTANYQPLPETCDGLPKLPVGTAPGTCLGLMVSAESGAAFIKPRKALEIPDGNRILVTDMGGWGAGKGILWLLEFEDNRYRNLRKASRLATGLNLPHDIKSGPGGYFYLGEADRIVRFQLEGDRITAQETVIEGLPFAPGKHLHPLTSFVFLPDNDLLVNAGSKSDDCGLTRDRPQCNEIDSVGLRRYHYLSEEQRWDSNFELYASGLRNSMALVVHPSGTILQGENSTDRKDAEEPYEEINIIREGGFYGWPYCFNRKLDTGFIPDGCSQADYIEPYSLMPPHVAPLDMIYYSGDRLPIPKGSLLMSWHGYRVIGHRLVSYPTTAEGLPILDKNPVFNRDPIPPARDFSRHTFSPRGGSAGDAQHREIVSHWNPVQGLRPEGAPVGLLQLKDGSLLIVDDKNKALLRLSNGEAYREHGRKYQTADIDGIRFEGGTRHLLLEHCSGCHTELSGNPGELLNRQSGWLREEDGRTLLEHRLTAPSGFMPPTGRLAENEIGTILQAL
ncbi:MULTISPECIES: PQQ-dependent sugar dehydrogenase [unclassified Microbulbifer]|uniref:PQQ-dependent sugar dehydrogenase n=1 Tax=unclassified Microbulbifer TaxID=2619833 RepID=UPI0027E505FC|nr:MULTISPECIES: PQQ-dependent sugar dehydrogenase [unclassified Microbulbifer]